MGLHPLWATTLIYVLSAAGHRRAWRPAALRQFFDAARRCGSSSWASGATNATFNWAVSIGEVVRVVLLVLPDAPVVTAAGARDPARKSSRPARSCAWRWRSPARPWCSSHGTDGGGAHTVAACFLPDVLALLGGFAFALNNVMLKRAVGAVRRRAARWPCSWAARWWPVHHGGGAVGRRRSAGRRIGPLASTAVAAAGVGAVALAFMGVQPVPAIRRGAPVRGGHRGGDALRGAVRRADVRVVGRRHAARATVLDGGRVDPGRRRWPACLR